MLPENTNGVEYSVLWEYTNGDGERFYDDYPRSNVVKSLLQDSDDNDSGLIEDSETEEDIEFSCSNEEGSRTNGGTTSKDSMDLSSFDLHLRHNLSKEEIDNQKSLKFSWDVPAIGVSNCKWIGTGENILSWSEGKVTRALEGCIQDIWRQGY